VPFQRGTHLIRVVHRHSHTLSLEVVNLHHGLFTLCRRVDELQFTRSRSDKVGRTVLVSKGVTTDDDRLDPAWDRLGDSFDDDGFTEDGAAEDVADLRASERALACVSARIGMNRGRGPGTHGTVGTPPHLLELELYPTKTYKCQSNTALPNADRAPQTHPQPSPRPE
jgi:hypothetical protein